VDGNGFTISGFQAIALGLVTNTTLVQMVLTACSLLENGATKLLPVPLRFTSQDFPWQDFDKACSSIPSPKQPHLVRHTPRYKARRCW
jgi:hypothetical protein